MKIKLKSHHDLSIEFIVLWSIISFFALVLLMKLGLSGSSTVDGETFLCGKTISLCEYFVKAGSLKCGWAEGLRGPSSFSS